MKTTAKETKENIIKNTAHLIKSREETKFSFSERSGITRSTIYKILNGEVKNVQKSTVEKIANFFGVSVKLLEEADISLIEASEKNFDKNANPLSIPILNESQVWHLYNREISKLITEHPITYCYTIENNIIAIRLEKEKEPFFNNGEIIIVRRYFKGRDEELLVALNDKNIEIKKTLQPTDELVGHIIEERSGE